MRKINKLFFILVAILLCVFSVRQTKITSAESLSSEIVMELNSRRVLYEKNSRDKKYMASTTKILTAITIIENCNLDDIVTITEKTVGVEGSSIYLEKDEKLSVKHLLYGLMLRSGNDCAETLAVYCSGNIINFAKLMNETAQKIGANESNFVNPHGLHDDQHYTTAYDLALISCYAMQNDQFREIVSTKQIKIPFTTREYDRVLLNKNKMLTEFEGSTGIKTGYTKKAGRCLVSSCERNGMELICVVLNCPPMFERSKTLLSDTFENYKLFNLLESDNIIDFIKINRDEDCPIIIKKDIIIPLSKGEKDKIEIMFDYPKLLNARPKQNKEIGSVKIYCEKELLFIEKIYTI